MTNLQKETVKNLRETGLGYKAISNQTGIPIRTIRSFIDRCNVEIQKQPKTSCLNCGKPIISEKGRKPKKFCSRECGLSWWHQHTELIKKKAVYNFICPSCGKAFTTYGQSTRKYCSHQCYINDRFKGINNEA